MVIKAKSSGVPEDFCRRFSIKAPHLLAAGSTKGIPAIDWKG